MKHIGQYVILTACLTLGLALSTQVMASQQKTGARTALVIGNTNYDTGFLPNPVNDAEDMEKNLVKFGFDVTRRVNLTQNEMKNEIRIFGKKLRESGGVGLFYFAGHGVQVQGKNYLIPIGAKVEAEEDIELDGIDVQLVMSMMKGANTQINIIILDACRDNPFARSVRSTQRGLAVIDAPSQTLIAYATAPGFTAQDGKGRNGVYTEALIKYMQIPNLKIEDVFKRVRTSVREQTRGKQIPWESMSLEDDFYFNIKDPCSENSLSLTVGSRRLDVVLPKGWKTPSEVELKDIIAQGTAMFDTSLVPNVQVAVAESCQNDSNFVILYNLPIETQGKKTPSELVESIITKEAPDALNYIFSSVREKSAQLGVQMKLLSKPQALKNTGLAGGRMIVEASHNGDKIHIVWLITRNLLSDKSILMILGAAEPGYLNSVELVIESIIHR
ncbi:MAG: caspase family protein [Blastocatellia bacterium]